MSPFVIWKPIHRQRVIASLLLLTLSHLPLAVLSDTLSVLPQAWHGTLLPIPEADLSGAEPEAQKTIVQQRREVASLLLNNKTEKQELAEGYGRLGALYQVYQLASAAETSYQNAMLLDPANFRWAYYSGYLASQSGRFNTAIRHYQTSQSLKPDYPPLALRLGESWLELNRLEEATKALQSVVDNPGLRSLTLYHLAQIDLLQRDYAQAIEKLEEVLRLDPNAAKAHYPLALALRATGENERSREHMALRGKTLPVVDDPMIEELQSLNQGARRFFVQGLQASYTQDFTAATQAFAQGLEIEPDNQHARVSYARALFLSGKSAEAAQQLSEVLQNSPTQILALFLSGVLHEDQNQPSAAIKDYRRVLELEPDHYGAHYCLANQLFQKADYANAADHYQAALKSNPDIPPARLYELLALKHSGQSDAQILARLEAMINQHPDQQILRYLLIRLLVLSDDHQVKDTERARNLVNELVQTALIPPHLELQAMVAAAIGNFEQALTIQQQIMPALSWMGLEVQQQAQNRLKAYRNKEMPKLTWYQANQILRPPVTDAHLMFREYLSAVPF